MENSSMKFLGLVCILLLIPIAHYSNVIPSYAVTSSIGIIIPLYTYPGSTWNTVINEKMQHPSVPIIAIINPNSGPGAVKDQNYATGINNLKEAGVTVLGYVTTVYSTRDANLVMSEIDRYYSWYNIDGIFFDEMSTSLSNVAYYSSLDLYTKSKGATFTVGNPGTDTISSYVGTVDNIIIYETSGLPDLSILGGWHLNYDKSNFSLLAYAVPSMSDTFVNNVSDMVGYLYLTDDNLPNPWDSLPPYFSSLVNSLDSGSTPPPSNNSQTVSLSVKSADISSTIFSGMWTTLWQNGVIIQQGFTPFSAQIEPEVTYEIFVDNWQNIVFDHWEDGSTLSMRPITISKDSSVTAFYQTEPINSQPDAVNDTITTSEDKSITIDVLANDSDSDGDALSVTSTSTPSSGTTTINVDSTVTYNPNQNFAGSDSFSYTISDGKGGTDTATVSVTIERINDTLTVMTSSLSGKPISGLWTEIWDGETLIVSGFSPLSYELQTGKQYIVYVADWQNYRFKHWEDNSTDSGRTITLSQDTTITAYYHVSAKIKVVSVDMNGNTITGLWTELHKDNTIINTGYTTNTFTVSSDVSYVVAMADYQNYIFDHWENGNTNRFLTITPSQDITLIAYYQR